MEDRRPGFGRYAHVEREQRWRLGGVPEGAVRRAEIRDRYLVGTRLRLRVVHDGAEVVRKLAQKVRPDPADPETVRLTNLYLSADEFDVLATLPADEIHKIRWRVEYGGRPVSVDEFHGRHHGLILAEVELGPGEAHLPMPLFAREDVTNDDRYSGGALARAADDALAALLGR